MVHGQLDDSIVYDGGHGRYEPVHFRIKRDVLDGVCPVCPQRATRISDTHAGYGCDHPVGKTRGHLASDELVFSVASITEYEGVTFFELAHQHGDVRWIILQVAVHGHQNLATTQLNASDHGWRLAKISPQSDHAQVVEFVTKFAGDIEGCVVAAVIHQDDFAGVFQPAQNALKLVHKRLDVFFFIKQRDDNG